MTSNAAKGSSKASRVVVLKLSPSHLSAFPSDQKQSNGKRKTDSPTSSTSTPSAHTKDDGVAKLNPSESVDLAEAGADNPADNASVGDPLDGTKGITSGAKAGVKRTLAEANEGSSKPRGKPGPKKKLKPGDMIDGQPYSGPAQASTVKLNPKASAGAINDRLRALDRTGAPCRKWARKGFSLKSFTGIQWDAPTWKAPPRSKSDQTEDVKSDSSVDGLKAQQGSSIVASEGGKSNAGDASAMQLDVASSPAPVNGITA